MRFDERQSPAGGHTAAHFPGRACPFCRAPAAAQVCGSCGRDTTAPRRPCGRCRQMAPSSERECRNCGAVFRSDLRWKVPLIVFLFLLAFVISVLLALVR
jgi:predicted amidophosphoribosyltransferase